jgi:hypothetical protein
MLNALTVLTSNTLDAFVSISSEKLTDTRLRDIPGSLINHR